HQTHVFMRQLCVSLRSADAHHTENIILPNERCVNSRMNAKSVQTLRRIVFTSLPEKGFLSFKNPSSQHETHGRRTVRHMRLKKQFTGTVLHKKSSMCCSWQNSSETTDGLLQQLTPRATSSEKQG